MQAGDTKSALRISSDAFVNVSCYANEEKTRRNLFILTFAFVWQAVNIGYQGHYLF